MLVVEPLEGSGVLVFIQFLRSNVLNVSDAYESLEELVPDKFLIIIPLCLISYVVGFSKDAFKNTRSYVIVLKGSQFAHLLEAFDIELWGVRSMRDSSNS